MEEQKWILHHDPQSARGCWGFHATAPVAEDFFYRMGEGAQFLTVRRWKKQRKIEDAAPKITRPGWRKPVAANKGETNGDEIEPTAMDPSTQANSQVVVSKKSEARKRPSSSSPRKGPTAQQA